MYSKTLSRTDMERNVITNSFMTLGIIVTAVSHSVTFVFYETTVSDNF